MSDGQGGHEPPDMTSATAVVVRGGNREVAVEVDLVCPYPDGQYKYEITAVGRVTIPAGDPLPVFVVKPSDFCDVVPARIESKFVLGAAHPSRPPFAPFSVHAHTVCRDPEGKVKWEADIEPITLAPGATLPPELAVANTVVTAAPLPHQEDYQGGH